MKIAFSPCPNDTFIFHAWVHGLINGAPPLDVMYADIDVTNKLAAGPIQPETPDVMKISFAALPWVLEQYRLIPCGGALGRGNGPLVLTAGRQTDQPDAHVKTVPPSHAAGLTNRNDATAGSPRPAGISSPAELAGKRIAVPSERSTAYLLFRLWAAKHVPGGLGEIVVMPFADIMPAVRDGKIDAGLVIHEARFTYKSYGLSLLADLGSWWEADTGLPIPLGAIIARRSLGDADRIADWIRQSLAYAWANPEASRAYVLEHAQEMDPAVAQAHIDLYVNDFSADLGEEGFAAIHALLDRAAREGLVPACSPAALR